MTVVMKVIGLSNGIVFTKDMWVESYDLDCDPDPSQMSELNAEGIGVINSPNGGRIVITPFQIRAQRFDDNAAALIVWNTRSKTRPYRRDGKPNKPMTALTVQIEPSWPSSAGWDATQ